MTKKKGPTIEAPKSPAIGPAATVELWDIDRLIPNARNARLHSPQQIDQIAASLKEWGFTTAVLADENCQIIAGHGRVLAAQKLGLKKIPVMEALGWTEEQKRAYAIADNKLALNSTWDIETLRHEIGELGCTEFDVGLLGFDTSELSLLFTEVVEGPTDPIAEWKDMPDFGSEDLTSYRRIVVHFANEDDVQAFAETIGQKIPPKMKYLWFPEKAPEVFCDKRYVDA